MKTKSKQNISFSTLINPFETIAGLRSLIFGLAIILITALLSSVFYTHHSGIIDVKYGQSSIGLLNFVLYGMVNVLVVSVLLFVSGLIFSKSSIRFIDVIGTQSLARFPMLFTPFLNIGDTMERFGQFIMNIYLNQGEEVVISTFDWVYVIFGFLVLILVIVWVIVLMFNSYRVSCNVKGPKAIISFIVILIIAEVFSIIINVLQISNLV